MKYNLRRRLGICVFGTALVLITECMSLSTNETTIISSAEIESIIMTDEIKKQFFNKDEFRLVIDDMKDSVNTIWIITAAVNIIAM